MTGPCQHGLFGPCPDCPPAGISVGERGAMGIRGLRMARVMEERIGWWVQVERVKESGALDFYTWHLTKRAARRAAEIYERTGKVKGFKP